MDSAILDDLVATLSQIKIAGQPNVPVVIDHTQKTLSTLTLQQWYSLTVQEWSALAADGVGTITVTFYVAPVSMEQLGLLSLDGLNGLSLDALEPVFSENSTANPSSFYTANNRTFYVPPDSLLNDATGLSDTLSQRLYYVTVTMGGGVR